MDTFYKALAVALKDLQVFLKDRAAAIAMLLVPVIMGAFSAAMYGGGQGGIQSARRRRQSGRRRLRSNRSSQVLSGIAEVELTQTRFTHGRRAASRRGRLSGGRRHPDRFYTLHRGPRADRRHRDPRSDSGKIRAHHLDDGG